MICLILVIVDLVCTAFDVQFAQDAVALGAAAFLEVLAEMFGAFIISVTNCK